MTPVTTAKGKRIAVFGLGGSGIATARALVAGGADVICWDDNPDSVSAAGEAGLAVGDLRDIDWAATDSLVLAPGVPLTHPKPHWTVDLAKSAGVEVIGDVELFCRERRATAPKSPFVAITGTNGKSTTTALIAHVLKQAGRDVQLGGNIGTPILALDPPAKDRYHMSSNVRPIRSISRPRSIRVSACCSTSPRIISTATGHWKTTRRSRRGCSKGADRAICGIDDPRHSIALRTILGEMSRQAARDDLRCAGSRPTDRSVERAVAARRPQFAERASRRPRPAWHWA
jgi:hypothetical protein